MLPSGIFVRTGLDDLISSLPGRLMTCGPSRLTVELDTEHSGSKEHAALEISQWSDGLCLIEITGPEELTALVIESVVLHEPVIEVLSCHYRPEAGEYSYALYREGRPLETFESRGPSLETVNFTSELRRVPLQSIIRGSDFMIDSMSQFGVYSSSKSVTPDRKVIFHVNFPERRTFWQMLLGAISSR
jgi:hypothetical protein